MAHRIRQHQAIRDDLLQIFRSGGLETRTPQAGSYLFPSLPSLCVSLHDFVRLLRYQANVTVKPGTEFGPNSDRKSVVEGKSVSVRVDLGGRRISKTRKNQ